MRFWLEKKTKMNMEQQNYEELLDIDIDAWNQPLNRYEMPDFDKMRAFVDYFYGENNDESIFTWTWSHHGTIACLRCSFY